MSKKITHVIDNILYKIFGYVSPARRSSWQEGVLHMKDDFKKSKINNRALLIISKPNQAFDDLNYLEDE